MIAIAHDFETTGVNPKACGVVQSAIAIVDLKQDGTYEVIAEETRLHHPDRPIPDGAAAVHGIYDHHVEGLESFEVNLADTYAQAHDEFSPVAVLGYNSNKYDNVIARRVGLREGLQEIDLMIAAQRLMSQGYLKRARLVDAYEGLTGKEPENAHDALADVTMTLDLIQPAMALMGHATLDEFLADLAAPKANPDMPMPFGKHKGLKLSEIKRSYLKWLTETATDINADLLASAKAALEAK